MDATPSGRTRRFRLATNDNETILDDQDVAGHALTRNDNETIVDDQAADDQDVEGHRLAANDSEIVIDGLRRFSGDDDESDDLLDVAGPTRIRAR